jgi:hypothetical protein
MAQVVENPEKVDVADGGTDVFATTWTFERAEEVEVAVDDGDGFIVQPQGVAYLLTVGDWLNAGADCIFQVGYRPSSGARVLRRRVTPIQQVEPFGDQASFQPSQSEAAYDRLTRMGQEQAARQGRSLSVPLGEAGLTIPGEASRAGALLAFDPITGAAKPSDVSMVALVGMVAKFEELANSVILPRVAVAHRAALAALPAGLVDQVWMSGRDMPGDGGEGSFQWIAGDQSAKVAQDAVQGVWVAPATAPTGAAGAWRRVFYGSVIATWFGVRSGGIVDCTAALRAAFAIGQVIYLPAGRYLVRDELILSPGQALIGEGRTVSVLVVDATFNMTAARVLRLGGGEPGATVMDIGIEAVQSPTTPNRAALIPYPPLLDAVAAPRCQIDKVRLSGGIVGLDARGNSGGTWIGRLEVGVFGTGLRIDGALDFFHIDSYHFWPFAGTVSTSPLGIIYRDGVTEAARIGACDGLNIDKFSTFTAAVVIEGSAPSTIAGRIGSLQMDGENSRLIMSGQTLQVGECYSTKTSLGLTSFSISGGRLTISSLELNVSGTVNTPVVVSGGRFTILGGRLSNGSTDGRIALATGGRLQISDCTLDCAATARTVPFIEQTGATAALIVTGCQAPVNGAGGPIIKIGTDLSHHQIQNNVLRSWALSLPAMARLGSYGPNSIEKVAFTPTVEFATNGTFAPTYDLAQGQTWRTAQGVEFEARMILDVNNYTGASGPLRIKGAPVQIASAGPLDAAAVTVGQWSFIDLSPGYTQLGGRLNVTANAVELTQSGDAVGAALITTTNIPPNLQNVEIVISGFIPCF